MPPKGLCLQNKHLWSLPPTPALMVSASNTGTYGLCLQHQHLWSQPPTPALQGLCLQHQHLWTLSPTTALIVSASNTSTYGLCLQHQHLPALICKSSTVLGLLLRDWRLCPGGINQTEKARRWGRVGESQMGGTTAVLPYVCPKCLTHFNIICNSFG